MNVIKGSRVVGVVLAGMMASSAFAQETEQAPGTPPAPNTKNTETHASGDNTDMLQLARSDKGAFIGKILYFTNGQEIGEIKDVLRRTSDQDIYMIVAAQPFFNEEVDFAVPVGDVSHIAEKRVELPAADGMHLRGMEYRAEDYEEIAAGEDRPVIADP